MYLYKHIQFFLFFFSKKKETAKDYMSQYCYLIQTYFETKPNTMVKTIIIELVSQDIDWEKNL